MAGNSEAGPSGGLPLITYASSSEIATPTPQRSLSVIDTRQNILGRRSPRGTVFQPWRRQSPAVTGRPMFMSYLNEVTNAFYEVGTQMSELRQDTGMAVTALSLEQQQQFRAMVQLRDELQRTGQISDARADQYWSDLQALHEVLQEDHQRREDQIHEAVHRESTERQHHQRELAQGVEQARSDIIQTQQVIQNWADGHLQNYVTEAIQTAVGQVPQEITTDQVQQMITASMQALLPEI